MDNKQNGNTNGTPDDKEDDRVEARIAAFLKGELTTEEANKLRTEIENNKHYAAKIEQLMFGDLLLLEQLETDDLAEEQQQKIIQRGKWRNKFSNIYMTLLTLVLIGIVLFVYTFSNSLFAIHWFGPKVEDIQRVTSDVIQFTKPGVVVGMNRNSSRFLTSSFNFDLVEQVGRADRYVGSFQENLAFNQLTSKFNWEHGQHRTPFYFRYPLKFDSTAKVDNYDNPNGWTILGKLPEGTVAQLAISFNHLMTLDEYYAIIRQYDLTTTWYAVDTGVESKLPEDVQLLGVGLAWGYAERGMQYGANGTATIKTYGDGELRAKTYVDEMKYLLDHERLTKTLFKNSLLDPHERDVTIAERYQYLKTNGVKIYGVILNGPVAVLLKLKHETALKAPYVGSIDWWNWDQQANGVEFSY